MYNRTQTNGTHKNIRTSIIIFLSIFYHFLPRTRKRTLPDGRDIIKREFNIFTDENNLLRAASVGER